MLVSVGRELELNVPGVSPLFLEQRPKYCLLIEGVQLGLGILSELVSL